MTTQVSICLEDSVISALDRLARFEFRSRDALVRSAVLDYIGRLTQMEELKDLAMAKFLDGELNFDDFARIVGYERAVLAREIDQALKENIKSARADFADWA